MNRIFTLPNGITCLRIIGATALLGLPPLSVSFFILYTLCGFSDVLDGWVARLTRQQSEFGAKLDSLSDLLFYAVMLGKIFPLLWTLLPKEIWIAVSAILVIRILSYVTAAIRYKRFASLHTYLNKATGLALFSVPYCLNRPWGIGYCAFVCVVGALASTEELIIHLRSARYTADTKTLWHIHKTKQQ